MRDRDRSSVACLLSLIHRESDGSVHGRRCEDAGRPVSGSARGCRPRIRMVLSDPDKVLAKDNHREYHHPTTPATHCGVIPPSLRGLKLR